MKEYCESRGGKLISEEWITAKTTYKFKCGNPEHPVFESTADALYSGSHWCPYCCGRKGNFEDEIREIIESKDGELLSSYKNANSHVRVKCNKHNYEWDIRPLNIKKGRWCPICNLPFSEKVVWDYLNDHKLTVSIQYKFDDLCGNNGELLKFDFAILDKQLKPLYLIEIDDREHRYNPRQERRIKARERDKIKDEYCIKNNIKLYRIPYLFDRKQITYEEYYLYLESKLQPIYYSNIIKEVG